VGALSVDALVNDYFPNVFSYSKYALIFGQYINTADRRGHELSAADLLTVLPNKN